MLLAGSEIVSRIRGSVGSDDPLVVTPEPALDAMLKKGAASLDLRLGTWFLRLRQARLACISPVNDGEDHHEHQLVELEHVRFGSKFYLHPRAFVLGATLEWVRIPTNLGGYVVGRSSWGRRGLVIATAVGVHPGFTGTLTLELRNLGELPIELTPGIEICQLFLHTVDGKDGASDQSQFIGQRRPILGPITIDDVTRRLDGVYPPGSP